MISGREGKPCDWRRWMSDNVAYALWVYTSLQIFMTVAVLKGPGGSILPYLGLALLVGAVLPGFSALEKRWERLSCDEAANPALEPAFRRDRRLIWTLAIGLPFVLTLLLKVLDALI
ncbi:hypothetical protein MB02_06625 [Croceicoccus estronivorus]|nr:hypothetical protein MB02_06625 [Croceicoccus estronivorus]